MPAPTNDVAQLIMQLMSRGRSGGLPMQASPELTQYLAHAQGGTAPPQLRGMPSADVLQGPGSGAAAIRDPNFEEYLDPNYTPPSSEDMAGIRALSAELSGRSPPQPSSMDMVTNRPPPGIFRNAGRGPNADDLFIWYTNAKGQRVRLDGPFTNDIEAARALKELRQSGLDPNAEVEIAPDFDPRT